ncbi:MAG: hypothetical protein LBT66_07615 [Methanobrevibacter sp.]|jgi:IS5 family transposase|nr:hypothetical protein [Candidatus Methanovirga meridionalis]
MNGYRPSKDVSQDATFYTADPGHKRADYPRGDQVKTHRCRDGSFAKKNNT